MKLYPIHAMGISAYCSNLIIDPSNLETVYFLSVAGYQATVKGIMANLLENNGISIEIDNKEYYLERAGLTYKTQVKKLPSGMVHGLLYPKLAMPKSNHENQDKFFVFPKESKELMGLFFRHLNEKTEVPLHPSWDKWLFKVFKDQGWTLKLKTLVGDFRGFSFEFNPKLLHDLIAEAIQNRVPEIIQCMLWKGGNDGKFHFS